MLRVKCVNAVNTISDWEMWTTTAVVYRGQAEQRVSW